MKYPKFKYTTTLVIALFALAPFQIDCSGAGAGVPAQQQEAELPSVSYGIDPNSAGYLISKDRGAEEYNTKWYLPSTTPFRKHIWTVRNQGGERLPTQSQSFSFFLKADNLANFDIPSYFKLRITVDGYRVTDVQIVQDQPMSTTVDEMTLNRLKLNLVALYAQFCQFADQLQYNSTTFGRGVGTALQSKVREALNPLSNAIQQYVHPDQANSATIKNAMQEVSDTFINNYVDYYGDEQKLERLKEYVNNGVQFAFAMIKDGIGYGALLGIQTSSLPALVSVIISSANNVSTLTALGTAFGITAGGSIAGAAIVGTFAALISPAFVFLHTSNPITIRLAEVVTTEIRNLKFTANSLSGDSYDIPGDLTLLNTRGREFQAWNAPRTQGTRYRVVEPQMINGHNGRQAVLVPQQEGSLDFTIFWNEA